MLEAIPYDYQIVKLDESFFAAYPEKEYPELLQKDGRPYTCLLFQTHYDYFICIPYRSYIRHNNAFKFKKSKRAREKASGLDYSKMVIVKNPCYISDETAVIDKDEYNETVYFIKKIQADALHYLDKYIEHVKRNTTESGSYQRNYTYTTLKYFHREIFNSNAGILQGEGD